MNSIIQKVIDTLKQNNIGFEIGAGKYPSANTDHLQGKVIFAGGMGISSADKPRKILGGKVLQAELFKVVLQGQDYTSLEQNLHTISTTLKNAGYVQLSGLEHIECDKAPQLAITYKSI